MPKPVRIPNFTELKSRPREAPRPVGRCKKCGLIVPLRRDLTMCLYCSRENWNAWKRDNKALAHHKLCVRCEKPRHFRHFTKSQRSKDGYQSWCKDCVREAVRASRSRNRRPGKSRQVIGITEKECRKCGHVKLLEAFNRSQRIVDGHQEWCKACQRAYQRGRYRASAKERLQPRRAKEPLITGNETDLRELARVLQKGTPEERISLAPKRGMLVLENSNNA